MQKIMKITADDKFGFSKELVCVDTTFENVLDIIKHYDLNAADVKNLTFKDCVNLVQFDLILIDAELRIKLFTNFGKHSFFTYVNKRKIVNSAWVRDYYNSKYELIKDVTRFKTLVEFLNVFDSIEA